MNDVRLAARQLAKSPGFAVVAVGLLTIGLASNVLIFSIADAVLWRPLPVDRPDELVRIVQRIPRIGTSSTFHHAFYLALREHSTMLSTVFGEAPIDAAMSQPAPAEQIRVHGSTPEFFTALGARALVGRAFTEADATGVNSETPPAVLSHAFWQRRFKGDPGVVGQPIVLGGHPFVVVGVMPRVFNGVSADTAPDLRVPLQTFVQLWPGPEPFDIEGAPLDLAARLKPGATREQAEAETLGIWRASIEPFTSDPRRGRGIFDSPTTGVALDRLDRGISILRDRYAAALRLLLASVGLLLLMVCANVTGLLLARVAGRRDEIALRLALGATRGRLARQLLTESFLLTGLGAAAGVLLTLVVTPWAAQALPPLRDLGARRLPLAVDFDLDGRVLVFALGLVLLTGLLAAVVPALTATRTSLDSILRSVRASGRWRGRQIMVVVQIAACTILLAGAGLLRRSFDELQSLDPGFDRDRVVTFTLEPGLAGYTAPQQRALADTLISRVRELPGAESVALAWRGVLRGRGIAMTVAPAGQRPSAADFLGTNVNAVTPGYFTTMGMRLVAGRELTDADGPAAKPEKVVVNQAFVRRHFPDRDPIGERFGPGAPEQQVSAMFEIAGVVSDAKYRSMREPMMPTIYQFALRFDAFVLHVRSRATPQSIIEPVRQTLRALDPTLPLIEVSTLAEEASASTAGERLTAALASVFAATAAAITAVGLYGLLAYIVMQRRREIGIRMALGARIGDIGVMVGRQAGTMVTGGTMLGLGGALAAAQTIRSLLYGVEPWDVAVFAAAAAFVILVAAVATAIPVARAVQIEPAAALRQET